ncbi:MAG: hypothetical protein AAGI66_08600 [Cyanobacteria bacterium P01_H01_bin.74]
MKKLPSKKTFLEPTLREYVDHAKAFVRTFANRYQTALNNIDEALQSENLKEKTWATDHVLKNLNAFNTSLQQQINATKDPASENFEQVKKDMNTLSNDELLDEITKALYQLDR